MQVAEFVLKLPNHVMRGKRISIENLKHGSAIAGDNLQKPALESGPDATGRHTPDLPLSTMLLEERVAAGPEDQLHSEFEQGFAATAVNSGKSPDLPPTKSLFKIGQPLTNKQQPAQLVQPKPCSQRFGEFYLHLKSLRNARLHWPRCESQANLSNLRFARRVFSGRSSLLGPSQTVLLLRFQSPY